jgi:hypothetical protein
MVSPPHHLQRRLLLPLVVALLSAVHPIFAVLPSSKQQARERACLCDKPPPRRVTSTCQGALTLLGPALASRTLSSLAAQL